MIIRRTSEGKGHLRRVALATVLALSATACVKPDALRQLMFGDTPFAATDIATAEPGFSELGMPVVNIRLTPRGRTLFAETTKRWLGKPMPIRLDGRLLSEPVVVETILGGELQILGAMTVEQSTQLAIDILGKRR